MSSRMEDMQWEVVGWIVSRIGRDALQRKERAMRMLEETFELAQAEGITLEQCKRQMEYVYSREPGNPYQEAGGVAVCLLGWCAAWGTSIPQVARKEIDRIKSKSLEDIRGSLKRKGDKDLITGLWKEGDNS